MLSRWFYWRFLSSFLTRLSWTMVHSAPMVSPRGATAPEQKDRTCQKSSIAAEVHSAQSDSSIHPETTPVPLSWKLMSVLLVTLIGFGSQWSSGVTGAMKSTIKKELNINNTQFSLLEASEDFMVTVLMLLSGIVTDRIGGAGMFCAYSCHMLRYKANTLQGQCFTAMPSILSALFSLPPPHRLALTNS
jgi:hypothetical protein